MSYTLVSVVLPFYRQADHLRQAVDEYAVALDGLPIAWELILVPNGPDDGSVALCRQASAADSRIRMTEPPGAGWGAAVKAGLRCARGDLLCYANSARTTGADLAMLIAHALSAPGTVLKANRKVRESLWRRLGSLVYNLECRALFDVASWDINGTPKIFPGAFDRLLRLEDEGDLIDLEFLVICRSAGYPILEMPIISTERRTRRSTTGMRTAVRLYVGALAMWRALGRVR
jgi:glycosyltransferase involved in cell wall biosynthesis